MSDTPGSTAIVSDFVAPSTARAQATSALEEMIASLPPPESSPEAKVAVTPEKAVEEVKADPPPERPEVVEPPKADNPGESAALAKFVEREVALRHERDALDRLRTEVETRMQALEKATATYRDFPDADALRADPFGFMAKMGLDPDLEVQKRLAAKLGDKAPAELRQAIRDAERDRELRALKDDLKRRDQEAANRTFFQQVHDGALTYVSGEIKNAPTLAKMAKEDAKAAHAEIMDEIIRDANARRESDPEGSVISYEEATRRAEARIARYGKYFAAPSSAGTPPVTTPTQEAKAGASPAAKPVAPTLDRPLGYWVNPDREAQREAAINEALKEAHRVTTINR